MGEKAKVAVLVSGRGTNLAALIYAARAEECPYEIVLVSGDRPDAPGLALAEAEGIEVVRLPSPARETKAQFFSDLDRVLSEASADYVVLAGFMRILPDAFVADWAGRMINIHPSLLPKYRGLGTYQAALDARDAVAGCTVHLVTAELDSGPILGQCEVAVIPDDTAETLAERVRVAEHQLLPRVLAEYVAREFMRFGLKAAGENGTFFQTVPMVREYMDTGSALFAGETKLRAITDVLPAFSGQARQRK